MHRDRFAPVALIDERSDGRDRRGHVEAGRETDAEKPAANHRQILRQRNRQHRHADAGAGDDDRPPVRRARRQQSRRKQSHQIAAGAQEKQKAGLAMVDRQLLFDGRQERRENNSRNEIEKKDDRQKKHRSELRAQRNSLEPSCAPGFQRKTFQQRLV